MTQALVASDTPRDVTAPDTGTLDVLEPDAVDPSPSDVITPETTAHPGGDDDRVEDMAVLRPLEPEAEAEPPEGSQAEIPDPIDSETVEAAPVPPVETATPAPSPSTALSPDPETHQPVLPETTVAPAPDEPETVTAQDSEEATSSAVTTSLRPPKERPSPATSGLREGTPAGRATGTIESPLTAYKRTGVDPFASAGGAARSGATGFSGARNPGNAGTTNYAGQVLVQLNRFPPVDRSVRGAAQVSFGINPDGTVAWVNILRSTGHPGIRRAATAQVRRAAPFPPPPEGASQRMVFSYQRR
jgi:TonB family protein